MSYTKYESSDYRFDPSTGQRYYLCSNCSHINVLDDHKKQRKDSKWILLTKRDVKKMFKVIAATLDMSYEETLLYLMTLHDKEKRGMYNEISPAGINKQ